MDFHIKYIRVFYFLRCEHVALRCVALRCEHCDYFAEIKLLGKLCVFISLWLESTSFLNVCLLIRRTFFLRQKSQIHNIHVLENFDIYAKFSPKPKLFLLCSESVEFLSASIVVCAGVSVINFSFPNIPEDYMQNETRNFM